MAGCKYLHIMMQFKVICCLIKEKNVDDDLTLRELYIVSPERKVTVLLGHAQL
jgi:hypothetical protein